MQLQNLFTLSRSILSVASILIGLCATSLAQTETVLYSFTGSSDGSVPNAGLVADSAGNYYGTAFSGGSFVGAGCAFDGCGVVYRLSPNGSGGWTQTVLYTFTGGTDGGDPGGTLAIDSHGNLYGTTIFGGVNGATCTSEPPGCGVVFELSPSSSVPWTETVLYSFLGGNDGFVSESPITLDSAGNLYGTTSLGGPVKACNNGYGCGEVFKLTPNGTGGWTYSVVHFFTNGKDGGRPQSGVVVDSAGDIFTTTEQGGGSTACGSSGCGTLVEFVPHGSAYTIRLLYAFPGGRGGSSPVGGLMLDSSGNVYGTAEGGGDLLGPCKSSGGCGLVFKETRGSAGGFRASVLYTFTGHADGSIPISALIMDPTGNLYGTTFGSPTGVGDCGFPCGEIYKLAPNGVGAWTQSVYYAFLGGSTGGILNPGNGLIMDASGNIFGTTSGDGVTNGNDDCGNGCGIAYEIAP
jgi:uncharacterized repeat protein (TIGR03803 family)